ncbi:hypothetical protein FACS1894137_01250 [Spirochaetia bacterium]|nr:hypothetical protein FACS1894137_01250 [Spirochaetia bacterium]
MEQRFTASTLENYLDVLKEKLEAVAGGIKPGMRIAVTAGSRGIYGIDRILKTLIDFLKSRGTEPFIVSAMGSHGGASVKGQIEVLTSLGITEDTMGCKIRAGTDSTRINTLPGAIPVMVDTAALEADGIVVVNRIKPHTGFRGKYESGLMKMLALGLGNHHGANYIHSRGIGEISAKIEAIAMDILSKVNVLFGVGILENGEDKIGLIEVIPADDIPHRETELLKQARTMLPEIYFKNLDLLIVDRIGKNISGSGMDPNITGGFIAPGVETSPQPRLITVLDLTDETHGAAFGIGDADTTTRRLFDKIDFETTYPNCLVTCTPGLVKIPMVLANQRQAIQAALKMLLSVNREKLRIVRIQDTLHIGKIWVSEALLEEAGLGIRVLEEASDLVFNTQGDLF